MIENERQYKITQDCLKRFQEAVEAYDLNKAVEGMVSIVGGVDAAAKRRGATVFARAELAALESEVEVLDGQIRDYLGKCEWETTEDGGDHVYVDRHRRVRGFHAVGYCPGDCPLRDEGDGHASD